MHAVLPASTQSMHGTCCCCNKHPEIDSLWLHAFICTCCLLACCAHASCHMCVGLARQAPGRALTRGRSHASSLHRDVAAGVVGTVALPELSCPAGSLLRASEGGDDVPPVQAALRCAVRKDVAVGVGVARLAAKGLGVGSGRRHGLGGPRCGGAGRQAVGAAHQVGVATCGWRWGGAASTHRMHNFQRAR